MLFGIPKMTTKFSIIIDDITDKVNKTKLAVLNYRYRLKQSQIKLKKQTR